MSQPQPTMPDLRQLQKNVPEKLHPVLEWMGRNSKLLIGLVSAVILVVAAFSVTKAVIAHQASTARDDLADILLSGDPAEMDRLAAFAADAPESVALRARFELAQARMLDGDYQAAAQAFDELAQAGDPDVRTLAGMSRARCLLLAEDPAGALEVLEKLRAVAPDTYDNPVTRLYAAAAEQAGQTELAVAAYQELLAKGQGVETEYLLYKLNRLSADLPAGS